MERLLRRTWGDVFQSLLDEVDQILDLLRRPCPKDQAVPLILEFWISLWSIQLRENLIQDPALKVRRQYLVLLLLVSGPAMEVVACLNLFLYS